MVELHEKPSILNLQVFVFKSWVIVKLKMVAVLNMKLIVKKWELHHAYCLEDWFMQVSFLL